MAGRVPIAVPTVPLCPFVPATSAIAVAAPWVAVAEKSTGEPVNPAAVAVAPWLPATVPRTRVAVARPFAPEIEDGVMLPPPLIPHVTVVQDTGLPPRSVTSTE